MAEVMSWDVDVEELARRIDIDVTRAVARLNSGNYDAAEKYGERAFDNVLKLRAEIRRQTNIHKRTEKLGPNDKIEVIR